MVTHQDHYDIYVLHPFKGPAFAIILPSHILFSLLQVPLCDRLDKYAEDPSLTSKTPNVVHFPPDFEPIPAKPLFFDLALSHVEFPSVDDKLEQKKQQGGLTGFVKGWLGGWGGGKK